MKKKRFTAQQIIEFFEKSQSALEELGDRSTVLEMCLLRLTLNVRELTSE